MVAEATAPRRENVPWHILAPSAVACDMFLLRASAHPEERFLFHRTQFPMKIRVSKGGFKFLIGKLHKVGSVLFRCPKIRKAKYACGGVWRSDVCVLNVPSGHIKTCAAVRGSTTLCIYRHTKIF